MEICKREKSLLFLPINILTVWCAGFLGRTLPCVLISPNHNNNHHYHAASKHCVTASALVGISKPRTIVITIHCFIFAVTLDNKC